jgi:SAM-dependent methyltransferase
VTSDAPARWLVEHADLLPRAGDAIDIACGHGRHALWLAQRGLTVRAIDRDRALIEALNLESRRRTLRVYAEVLDLERDDPQLGREIGDVIVVVHYLHRPLFPHLIEALRPGGLLIYETFTRAQAARGKPTNPDFLLAPGELRTLVHPLEILTEREGTFDDREIASIVARRR